MAVLLKVNDCKAVRNFFFSFGIINDQVKNIIIVTTAVDIFKWEHIVPKPNCKKNF